MRVRSCFSPPLLCFHLADPAATGGGRWASSPLPDDKSATTVTSLDARRDVADRAAARACVRHQILPLDAPTLRAFAQFVADLECSTRFLNGEHLCHQSLFLGGNTSAPMPIDALLRLETLDADIKARRAVGHGN